jgi:small-conductance mechanosensitive channel
VIARQRENQPANPNTHFNQRVFAALKSADITIPFPQREVRVLNQKGQEPT